MSTSDPSGALSPDVISALANELFKNAPLGVAPSAALSASPAPVPAQATPFDGLAQTGAPALPSYSHLPSAGLPHFQGTPVVYGLPTPLGVPTPNNVPSYPGLPAVTGLPAAPALPSVSHLPSAGLPHAQGAPGSSPVAYGLPTPLGGPTPNNAPSYPGLPATTGLPAAPALPSYSHLPSAGLPFGSFDPFDLGGSPAASAPHAHALGAAPSDARGAATPAWLSTAPSIEPEYYFVGTPKVAAPSPYGVPLFSVDAVRADFPILQERVNGKPLVWLDNAATTQKPQSVIDRIAYFYAHENSNVHRGAHTLAARSTDAYEAARGKVQKLLNAPSVNDIVFTRGTTESINLVAQSWGRRNLSAGDEIVITWLEHHSNIVPWQLLCEQTGAKLRVAPVDDNGEILIDAYERLFNKHTKLVSITHVSNALGTVLPVKDLTAIARRYGATVLIDGAQAVSHFKVDVQALDADFYVLSGHKLFGPTGIGVLYGKSDVLNAMPPWQGGGNMIADVTFDKTVYNPAPYKFEAGTGNIADAVGLGAAIDYLDRIGLENAARYEHELLVYGTQRLLEIPKLRLIGTAKEKAGVLSFVIDDVPTEQVGQALAKEGIAVRSGHHCAQPALRRFGLESTVRPSLAFYNTCGDIDALIDVLHQLQRGW